jgi:hypothetical protein
LYRRNDKNKSVAAGAAKSVREMVQTVARHPGMGRPA